MEQCTASLYSSLDDVRSPLFSCDFAHYMVLIFGYGQELPAPTYKGLFVIVLSFLLQSGLNYCDASDFCN